MRGEEQGFLSPPSAQGPLSPLEWHLARTQLHGQEKQATPWVHAQARPLGFHLMPPCHSSPRGSPDPGQELRELTV